jgi:choice-of-anchor C domain-containing protein
MKRLILIGAVVALALAVQPAWANLVGNGSFEGGSYVEGGGGFDTLPDGSTAITGWKVIGGSNSNAPATGSIDWIKTCWTAQNGSYSLDLDGLESPGGVSSDSFTTTVGSVYDVSFWMSGNPAGPPTVKVAVGNANPNSSITTHTFTYDRSVFNNDLGNMKWQLESFSFVASATSTILTIQSDTDPTDPSLSSTSNGPSYGAAIDNVDVELSNTDSPPVPEPVTMFSAFLAISGLGMYIRKRTKVPA